jgi:RNA polymerase sigma factor (sigma-70 family)
MNDASLPMMRCLRRALGATGADGLTDRQLLERFIAERDEAAFEALVWRHGPTVLGVCRRMLRQDQDAEDAFQAAFLLLVRKARTIGNGQAVASWLYRVAYRVALRARARQRPAEPLAGSDVAAPETVPDVQWRDLRPVLDEEVGRLPEKYRAPFVLCYLDGKTNEEAARVLGCPKGTVLSRLAWARQRLRTRLTRRGIGGAGAVLGAAVAPEIAAATVPTILVGVTVRAALHMATGTASAELIPTSVAALTQGVLQAMLYSKVKFAAVCVVLAGVLAVGGIALTRPTWAAWPSVEHAPVLRQDIVPERIIPVQAPAKGKAPEKQAKSKEAEKTYAIEVRDKPWKQVIEWYVEITGLTFVGGQIPEGTFTFVAPAGKRYTVGEITDILNELLLQQKYLLMRRAKSVTLVPADETIDPTLIPEVTLQELRKRGKTELVALVVPLMFVQAKDIAPEIKKLLGPFGSVVPLDISNQLLVRDTAGNLLRIDAVIHASEARAATKKE